MRPVKKQKKSKRSWSTSVKILVAALLAALIVLTGLWLLKSDDSGKNRATEGFAPGRAKPANPLSGQKFYIDNSRQVTKLASEYRQNGKQAEALLLERIASQPGTTWLVGPSEGDPKAIRDIETVKRTSKEAVATGTVPVYQLYAIPSRDACAAHSKGGFPSSDTYMAWIDEIVTALYGKAVFAVEADAIAHTINSGCMSERQITDRYALLKQTLKKLEQSDRVLGAYLDAGHSDWLPDPSVLIEPLRLSGIEHARGVAVNVSFFAETAAATKWSQQLVALLGGSKGAIIDTSRNGKGILDVQGDARWCNPPGRGIGLPPTTSVSDANIDAYFWGKNIGESDGRCSGYPSAGTFVPEIALELVRGAQQ
jgi:endoglucanase